VPAMFLIIGLAVVVSVELILRAGGLPVIPSFAIAVCAGIATLMALDKRGRSRQ